MCGVGDIIVSMLIDAKGFYDYDQRESGNLLETEEHEPESHNHSF